jgi:hypothetical protein
MNGGFLIDNIATLVTPTCAYADALFPAANLVDKIPSLAYRSSGGTALPRWNFGSAKTVTAFSMHNHNIPNDATIKLQFSSNNWSSVAEEVTLDWAAGQLFKTFTAKSYQYQALSVVSANAYVEIGEIFWGAKWQFIRNYNWSFRNIFRVYKKMTVNKGQAFSSLEAEQRGYALDFTNVAAAERILFEALLRQEKVVFIPDFNINVPLFGTIGAGENVIELDGEVSFGGDAFSLKFWADRLGAA